jgi:hypothetical protein
VVSNDPAIFQEFRNALGTRDPKTVAAYSSWMACQCDTTALCRILEPIPSVVEMPSIPGISTSIRMMERSERLHKRPYLLR